MRADGSTHAGQVVGVGTVIDDTYEIVGLLGRGGMGAVWLARHRRVPKKVAIKVLHQSAAGDPQALGRFRREAEVASRIGHPGIVEVLDFATLPSGEPYLVLEHLEGESLAARLTRGALPVDDALDLARQLGSALAAAHRQGVVHRDLKPENVFLVPRDRDGRLRSDVKVLDFGISKIQGSQTLRTQEAVLVGTPQYMAPEQATGKNDQVDARSDQFALAAIVHEMLAGRPPWTAGSLAETLFKVVYEAAPALEVAGLSAPARGAIERGLAKSAGDRFPDVAGFIEALTGSPLVGLERGPVVSDPGADALGETLDSGQRKPALGAGDAPAAEPATSVDRVSRTVQVVHPPALPRAVTPAPSPPLDTPVPAHTERDGRHRGRRRGPPIMIVGLFLLVAVLGGVIALKLRPQAPAPAPAPAAVSAVVPDAAARVADPVTSGGTPSDTVQIGAASPDAARAAAAAPDAARAPVVKRPPRPDAAPPPPPPPPPAEVDVEVAGKGEHPDLVSARARLAEGPTNPASIDEARRLATRALRDGAGPTARRVLVQIECAAKDLTRARAWLSSVPARFHPGLIRRCRALGLEL